MGSVEDEYGNRVHVAGYPAEDEVEISCTDPVVLQSRDEVNALIEELEEMRDSILYGNEVRVLGRRIERAGDRLRNHEEATLSQRALGSVAGQVGHDVVAVDGGRRDYSEVNDE